MFVKFVLFIAVAFCVTQGFQAYSVEPEVQASRNIIDDIKMLTEKINKAIADIVHIIPNLIKNLKDKITETINKIDIKDIINKIEDKIEAILAAAHIDVSDARKCIDSEKADVDQLIEDTNDSIALCKKTADERAEELAEEVQDLKTKADSLVADIKNSVNECFKLTGLNPIKFAECVKPHFANFKEEVDGLVRQISNTIAVATKTAADITVTLAKCTAGITTDIIRKQKLIIQDFQKCVNELKQ